MTGVRPKLVHVIHWDGPGGGPQSLITQLQMLVPHYEQCVLHGGAGRVAEFCERERIPHKRIALEKQSNLLRGWWQCWRHLQTHRPDVLVLHGQWAGPVAALAGCLARIRIRVYIARWPAFYANWDLWRSLRNHLAERTACALSHRVICLTNSSRYQYLVRHLGTEAQLRVVPNAIATTNRPDAARVRLLRETHHFDRYACNVISVGRLVQQKRGDWLLASWKQVVERHPNAHLWMVGQGSHKKGLQELAHTLNLDRHITWIEDDSFTGAEFIAAGDMLAHTALFETFGNVVLEAFMARKPVVATEVDGPRSIITHGHDGMLVPPGETDAFALALIRLIDDPHERARLGDAGRQTAEAYQPERITPNLLNALLPDTRPLMTHVVHHDGPGGGPPIIVSLIRKLAPWCRQSAIGGSRGLVAKYCERHGFSYREMRPINPRAWLRAGPALYRRIRSLRPDVLVVHGQPAGPIGALVGRLARVRHIVYVAQWPAFYTDWDWFRVIRNRLCEWLPCRLADVVVTFTSSSRHQYVLRKLAGPEKICCIPPALSLDSLPHPDEVRAVRVRHGWADENRHVVTVARLSDQKCIDQLLAGWPAVLAQCPTAHLWIVGDGPERDLLQSMAIQMGIESSCHFLGYQTDSRAYMAAADVLVITSMYESFGYVAVEGCAAGTPIVASRVDGLMDVIRDGREGYLVPPDNPSELAERLVHLLKNPELRAEMGRNGRLRAASFAPDRIRPLWFDLLHNRLKLSIPPPNP